MYGYYKGQQVAIHYTDQWNKKWYILIQPLPWKLSNEPPWISTLTQRHYALAFNPIHTVWFGAVAQPNDYARHLPIQGLYRAFKRIQRLWRMVLAKKRCGGFKEELLAVAMAPKRVEKWIHADYWELVE
jgi:UDP-N-acetyl-D-mannosaminuronic acid transferase (WecB/TagA/CpsF family)